MQNKKPIIIIAVLSVLALGLGYWVGGPDESSNIGKGTLKEGLWVYYPFAGDTRDQSGHGRHATNNGAILATDRFGKADRAYRFSGDGQWMDIPWGTNSFAGSFTISAWVYVDSEQGLNQWQNIVADPESGFQFLINNQRVLQTYSPSISGAQLPQGRWAHVALVNEEGRLTLFQGGEISARGPQPLDQSETQSPIKLSRIASWKTASEATNEYFEGKLDDIRIYDRALTEAEVKALYEFEKVK
jgi:hypothetical protein